jgi:cell division septum initiation protein DivIVA
MPRSKVAQDAIAARRARVAEDRLRGMTLAELARQEQVDKSTISRDQTSS